MRQQASIVVIVLGFVPGMVAGLVARAEAQPMMGGGAPGMPGGMPDLRVMMGKPLPAPDLPAGTVSVRVARKIPVNAVVGVEVTALLKEPRGETRKRTATTDDRGRAIFPGVAVDTEFRAEVTVDGERLETSPFGVPSQGGVKTMLIAGIGGPSGGAMPEAGGEAVAGGGMGAGAGPHGGEPEFTLGAATGAGVPDPTVPAGTVDVHVIGEDGKPVAGREVTLGEATAAGMKAHKVTTDASGVARFVGLVGGEKAGYAAVVEHEKMRLGTDPFRLPENQGVRAEIRTAGRTTDTAGLRLTTGSRLALIRREGAFEVIELLRLENGGSRIVDPGPAGVLLPLPVGFRSAQGLDGDSSIEEIKDKGVAVHTSIPPGGVEIRFAFILPATRKTLDFEQPMPYGLPALDIRADALPGLAFGGPLVKRQEESTVEGKKFLMVAGDGVPAGGKLAFTVSGLPGPDDTARNVAGALALALAACAIIGARRPAAARAAGASTRDRLADRREKLFAELLAVEKARRNGVGADTGKLDAQRRELVGKLETVYQEIAAADEARAS